MLSISSVKSVARDKVAVYFSEEVTVSDEFYADPSNYTITYEAGAVPVKRVLAPKNQDFINYVILATSILQEEKEYTVVIETLRTRLGVWQGPAPYSWVYQRTKTDNILVSVPSMYDISVASNFRSLLEAISIEDDLIGGVGRGVQVGVSGVGTEAIFAAGGDLFGYYPNPGVDGIQGRYVSPAIPVDGDVLTWDAANQWWVPRGGTGAVGVLDGSGNTVVDGSGNTVIQ